MQNRLDPHTVSELEVLRAKLNSLQDSFSSHLLYLNDPKFPFNWPDLLNKFNTLTAKFASLSEDFYGYMSASTGTGGSTLPKIMLHPHNPTMTEQETHVLGILLRTKLIPEIERMEEQTRKSIEQELGEPSNDRGGILGSVSATATNLEDDDILRKRLSHWHTLRKKHDNLATRAGQIVNELVTNNRDELTSRYESESEDGEAETKMETNAEETKEKEKEKDLEWKTLGFTSEEIWRKWQLECMLTYYSSGKSELQDSELKMKGGAGA
ncbi:hypothetical protein BC938DRAFT_470561, partial [Jimgerdemannia flammicorona]